MDKTWEPTDLFAKLSSGVAQALAAHLTGGVATAGSGDGRSLLFRVWRSLLPVTRLAFEPSLQRVQALSCRQARSCVLEQARRAHRDQCPAADRVLEAVSTPDLAVRLYLEDPSAFEHAHFQHVTALVEPLAVYQGQYVADVIPSHDRRVRMLGVLRALQPVASASDVREVADFVSDDRFLIALHRGAQVRATRCFDAAHRLDPDLCQPQIETAILFRFDSSMLVVKAHSRTQREALRDAFAKIFVGDPRYFEARRDPRPRYCLTIDPVPLAAATRPSLAKAQARVRAVSARDVTPPESLQGPWR